MELNEKEQYIAPTMLVVAVKVKGVVCTSGEYRSPWEEDD